MSGKTSERKHWDDFWASSDELGDVYANDDRIVEFLAGRFGLDGMRILEVGAGTGRDSAALAGLGARVFTVDYSEESLRLMAENLGGAVEIVCGDALALPFANESFDVVFHQGLLEHFRAPRDLLRENIRVLKTGGYLLVDVPQRFHYYTLLKHILMFLDKWFAGWETEFSVRELEALVASVGCEVEYTYGHNLYPPVWYRGVRRLLLRAGIRLPMQPFSGPVSMEVRKRLRDLVPRSFRLSTSMVIGTLGRKR